MRWMSRNDRRVKKMLSQFEWHQWYAWYPVKLSSSTERFGETVWLETINRRLETKPSRWMAKEEEYQLALRLAKTWPFKRRYIYKDLMDIIIDEHEKNNKRT